ncbi:signal transducer and activator of transcription 1-alpha/beta-like [Cheilinus undulatus]|uniref:signal transducer and activator of transcription 1-alpha/beta-like n=1 Tax=Cheilinus undulatus TaxID=241271 RepID=UPI001BD636B1|nr:signal transducer and activator of transcription 1-alpha/beta-like [Cheilinus undulatus]
MAQWQELQKLDVALQGQVSRLYESKIPRGIRQHLCQPIESQDWVSAAEDEVKAQTCLQALVEYLDEQWNRSVQENNILQAPNYQGMKEYLLNNFLNQPMNLAVILSECLEEERRILASAYEVQGCGNPNIEQNWRMLDHIINSLKHQTVEVQQEIKELERLNENLYFIQKNWQSRMEESLGLAQSQAAIEEECRQQANFITKTQQMVLRQIESTLNEAETTIMALIDVELPQWKYRQQMACIGSPVDTSLDHLEKWFTAVTEVLLQIGKQLQKLQDLIKKYTSIDSSYLAGQIANMEGSALSLLRKLLSNALVVEQQPVMASLPQRPLIIKTNVRFTVSVRFLANRTEFIQKSLHKVTPVFDKDVEEAKTLKGFRQFDFDGNYYKFMDVYTAGGLEAEFSHMLLKEKKGKAKTSQEPKAVERPAGKRKRNQSEEDQLHLTVLEELHIIKFVLNFKHAGLECDIEASSLPLVVISSTNQVPAAWASVMWYNMLSNGAPTDLSLFLKPPSLKWEQLSQVLSWQFVSAAKLGLNEDQLSTLRDKFVDNPEGLVHWKDFSKCDKKESSAWFWIDGILDLIQKHLADIWQDGSIMGFVSRARTEELLQEKQTGTFLLRFSESNKDGAITFSWVEHSNGETHVHAVEPYTKQELSVNSLPHIIYTYSLKAQTNTNRNPLLYLYPDIHKDTAFGRYYNAPEMSAPKNIKNGYVAKNFIPVSLNPTPPPSPTRELEMMDTSSDKDTRVDNHNVIQELFPDLLLHNQNPDACTTSIPFITVDPQSLAWS